MKRSEHRYEFEPIGTIQTCFKEKFGIPRQPLLVPSANGTIRLQRDPDLKTAIRGLERFSHLWIIFIFHQPGSKKWKPSIRPPRLGGAKKIGVLASRSPHRPNPIGMSAVELVEVRPDAPGGPEIDVAGVDLLDGTPILDLKPYLPYADSIPQADAGWALEPIQRVPVTFTQAAEESLAQRVQDLPTVKTLITELLELDPRPAFQKRRFPPSSPESQGTRFGFKLLDFDVQWEINHGRFIVTGFQDV